MSAPRRGGGVSTRGPPVAWRNAAIGTGPYPGSLLRKLDIPAAPIILTMTVGPMMEEALRQSLEISGGRFSIFVTRPISAALLVCAVAFLATSTFRLIAPVKDRDAQV